MIVEGFRGRLPVQGLAWAGVEDGGNGCQLVGVPSGQIGALGQEVLESACPASCGTLRAANPITKTAAPNTSRKYWRSSPLVFFVRGTLPGRVRVGEVDR